MNEGTQHEQCDCAHGHAFLDPFTFDGESELEEALPAGALAPWLARCAAPARWLLRWLDCGVACGWSDPVAARPSGDLGIVSLRCRVLMLVARPPPSGEEVLLRACASGLASASAALVGEVACTRRFIWEYEYGDR